MQELAWRQQLAAALAFRHASQWATNQLTSDVIIPCLIKLLKVSFISCVSCLTSRRVTEVGCRTAPLASANRSPTSMLQYGTRPQHRPRRLLTRQQVSGVLVSVLVMSRSFGTRMNAMEVPASSPSPSPALFLMLSLILGICRPSSEILRVPLPSSTDSRAHPSRRRPLLVDPPRYPLLGTA